MACAAVLCSREIFTNKTRDARNACVRARVHVRVRVCACVRVRERVCARVCI